MNSEKLKELNELQAEIFALKKYLRDLDGEGELNLKAKEFKNIEVDDLIDSATLRVELRLEGLKSQFKSL